MILRTLTLCCGLVFAGSAMADTCEEMSEARADPASVERIPASEAFQRNRPVVTAVTGP